MLYLARKLRGLVSIDTEYATRRALYALLPRAQPQTGALFHCCVHKTASQWVRLVISDPRFYMATGLMPRFAPSMQLESPDTREPVPEGSVVGSFFTEAETLLAIEKPADWRAFFVTRDPRDLLVSRYYSARFSHREDAFLARLRHEMRDLNDEEGILFVLENHFDSITERLLSFSRTAGTTDRIVLTRYEDLTGPNQVQVWTDLLECVNVPVPGRTIASILNFYRMERLRAPGSAGKKDEKYRSGKPGEWRTVFTPAITAAFDARHGDLALALGYR